MPNRPSSNPKQFIQQALVLQVNSVFETTKFYQDVLGFYCDYRTEVYGVVWRDNAATHFAQADTPQYGAKIFSG